MGAIGDPICSQDNPVGIAQTAKHLKLAAFTNQAETSLDDSSKNTETASVDQPTRKARTMDRVFSAVSILPLWANHALANVITLFLLLIPNRHRRVTWKNMQLCFAQRSAFFRLRLFLLSLREAVKGITELAIVWWRPPAESLALIREIEGEALIEDALARGDRILIGSPHSGCFELINLYLSAKTRCAGLYREPHDSGVEALYKQKRERLGTELIRADAKGIRRLMRRAKQGYLIGILPDHQPRRGTGVFVPFFGHDAFTMVLFSKLIQRFDPVVIFAYAERLSFGRGFRLHFLKPDPGIYDPDIQASASALNRTVEQIARAHLPQYGWTYKRFAQRPDGSVFEYDR